MNEPDIWPTRIEESRDKLHAIILAKAASWPEDIRMDFEEMAATLEYDQGNDRTKAERLAFWRIKKDRGM